MNNEQVVLLKNYLKIADASDLELKGCLEVSRRYRLDPFKQGQIWFVKRWDKSAVAVNGTKGAYVYTPQVGIYGMLHIAARDHKDFGSISEAEYGPMFTHEVETHKIKAPEWCRVKAFKKGIEQPTVATIYFEEFCPRLWDNARLFWATMPRAQIEKCAKARALRTAYPDLGGLYIPEEMDRVNAELNQDYTPEGRQIVQQDGTAPSGKPVTWEARNRLPATESPGEPEEAIAALKAKGLWCEEHQCPKSANHMKDCKATIDVSPKVSPAAKPEPWKFAGTVTIDHGADGWPVVTGDLERLVQEKDVKLAWDGAVSFYRVPPTELDALRKACVRINFEIREIRPTSSAPQRHDGSGKKATEKGSGKVQQASTAPTVVSGTIERLNMGKAGPAHVKYVTLLMAGKKKAFLGCFHKSMWDDLEEGLGKLASFKVVTKGEYSNIEGLIQIGSKHWEEDGTPVIQRKDQEAGQKTLY